MYSSYEVSVLTTESCILQCCLVRFSDIFNYLILVWGELNRATTRQKPHSNAVKCNMKQCSINVDY